jgi:hypothetical protein
LTLNACINVNIASGGPLLIAHIAVSLPRLHALNAAGAAVPPMATGTFLIDTGASCSCVDPGIIAGLGLQPTGRVAISTPSTAGTLHFCDQFDISIFIPSAVATVGHLIPAIPVVETHLRPQGIDGLIGRDVLKDCTLIYNGTAGLFTIAY